ncbi:hypothetical protein E4U14_006825 [Claviceps sp. LM454 group G7]|nr:hypothetical protein E4U14_006825 [Claviceps sp. LM454 group G7]
MDSLKAVILGASVVCAQSFSTSIMATPAGIAHTTEVVTAVTTDCPLETGKSAGGDECAKKCNEAYNACRVAPGANQSFCASKLASCVGYNPFTGGAFMSPTACSVGPAAATAPAATSPAGGEVECACAKKCNEEYNACRTAPDANMSLCSSKLASCVGYNPFTGGAFMTPTACSAGPAAATAPAATAAAGGDAECAKKCNMEYNACRTAPDANMSLCSSKLASCVGYNPFTGGAFMSPTACSAGPAAATAPAVTAAAGGDAECARKCNEEYNACRTAPDANMSLCSSKLASCVGYNPFTGGAFMSPTACSAAGQATGAAPTASAGSAGSQGGDAECAKKCNEEYNACRTAPDANMSLCSSKLASCVGYNPFTGGAFMSPTACSAAGQATGTDVSPPAVTAGAGQITPALALLALGAVALL